MEPSCYFFAIIHLSLRLVCQNLCEHGIDWCHLQIVLGLTETVDTFSIIISSTYKFKRAFFRHDRRTAPKFGTHVQIETRLALTKKIDQPHPRGV